MAYILTNLGTIFKLSFFVLYSCDGGNWKWHVIKKVCHQEEKLAN